MSNDEGEIRVILKFGEENLSPQECINRIENSGLPLSLVEYLKKLLQKDPGNRCATAIKQAPRALIGFTKNLIEMASKITGFDPEELLRQTDLDPNDFKAERLDSCISELRAILYLNNEGFDDIKLLRAQKGSKSGDIIAVRKGKKYAFDAATVAAMSSQDLHTLTRKIYEISETKFCWKDVERRIRNLHWKFTKS